MKRLVQLLTVAAMSLTFSAVLAGCRKEEEATTTSTSPSEPAQVPAAAMQVPEGPVGIAPCDDYLTKSERCVAAKAPQSERDALNRVIGAVRRSYKLEAITPEGKNKLPERCKNDFEQTKKTLQRFLCDWSDAPAAPADSAAAAAPSAEPAPSAEAAPSAQTADPAAKKKAPADAKGQAKAAQK